MPKEPASWPKIRQSRPSKRPVLLLDRSKKLIAIMADHWFRNFRQHFAFPANYVAIDIETNGVNPESKFICAIGHTKVRGGRAIETDEVYLNWSRVKGVDCEKFKEDLLATERALLGRGKRFHHSWDTLCKRGKDPIKVLEQYLKMFESMEANNEVLVAHNGWRFDIEFFQAAFHNYLRIPFAFKPELVYDSGICEKASQLSDYDDPLPLQGETMQQFAWRIGELRRKGVFWALDGYCADKYGLWEKTGLDPNDAHAAGVDTLLLHALVEEHRKLASVTDRIDMSTDDPQVIVQD